MPFQEENTTLAFDTPLPAIIGRPKESPRDLGIVFAHGSSNDMTHPTLEAMARGFSQNGYPTLRFNFPYRAAGRKSPDPEHRLLAAMAHAMAHLRKTIPCRRLILAGKSLGARMAAQGCAAGQLDADGLIFLGYPLHAPGKKDAPRTAPLEALSIPLLFFQGTRDPFCNMETLQPVFDGLTAPAQLEIIQNGDHGFQLPKTSPGTPDQVHDQMLGVAIDWLSRWN